MSTPTIFERTCRTDRHTSFYLEAGRNEGVPIIFLHGWPELSTSWRHQLPVFAGLGYRAIAPDLRGHGRSTLYNRHEAYAQREIVADVIELLDSLGAEKAVWVGHDWGAPVVWNLAGHHPDRCLGIAALNVPYRSYELGLGALRQLINREIYPEEEYPYGNFEYYRYYHEEFEATTRSHEANIAATFKSLLRSGNPTGRGKPGPLSEVRRNNGWFGGRGAAPDVPIDPAVIQDDDLGRYVSAYQRTGFFGTDSLYMNDEANATYASEVPNEGRLDMPVLFLGAEFDFVCDTVTSPLADAMPRFVSNLTMRSVPSGHWMAQERPLEVNAHLAAWLLAQVETNWPPRSG